MRNRYTRLSIIAFVVGLSWSSFQPVANASLAVDTLEITPAHVNSSVLIPGTHRYVVYFKMGKDSVRVHYQMWSRTIDFTTYQGKEAISVTQEWEDSGSVVHTVYTVCDRKTFQPFYQKGWWKGRGEFVFDYLKTEATIDGQPIKEKTDSVNIKRWEAFQQAVQQYTLNWHLDLEVFPTLPYQENRTFLIPYYDPGFSAPNKEPYSVIGSEVLTGYNGQLIDCWMLKKIGRGFQSIFWVSKKSKEVLKLEDEFGGRYRYKIKLGFSD